MKREEHMDDEELTNTEGTRPSDNGDDASGQPADVNLASDNGPADRNEPDDGARVDDDGEDEDNEDEPVKVALGRADAERRAAVPMANQTVVGSLILHYEARDVQVVLDGNSALRVLTAFARRDDRGLSDPIDPFSSSAFSGWFVADLDQPLAISWIPGLAGQRRRTVIDPPVAAA